MPKFFDFDAWRWAFLKRNTCQIGLSRSISNRSVVDGGQCDRGQDRGGVAEWGTDEEDHAESDGQDRE